MKTVNLYTFSELSEEAKKVAVRNHDVDYDLQFLVDDEIERLTALGFDDVDICYRLAFSQGDGVRMHGKISFTNAVDLTGYKLSALKTKIIDDWVALEISGNSVSVEWYHEQFLNYVDATVVAVVRELESWIEDNGRAFYRRLSNEALCQTSDEYKREDLENNDGLYYYFENGTPALYNF